MSVYLDPASAGLDWLLDPASLELRRLVAEAGTRTPETPCDADALVRDAEELTRLIEERHFGVATGVVESPHETIGAWEQRLAAGPSTWGEAVTALQFELREALRDEHVHLNGAPHERDGRPDAEGPAVEEEIVDGVLVLHVRRLIGDRADEELLAAWRNDADRHFSFRRIVVDLRGNPGGNDGHTIAWAERRFRAVGHHVRESRWEVRGKSLGSWNAWAWREANPAIDAPPHLAASKHDPQPGDRIELLHQDWPLEAGDRPWDGRMLVLVDRRTRSSGESSAWILRDALGAKLLGNSTTGMIEYGNIVPYVLPRSGLVVTLPTKRNDYGFPVESVGFPVDAELDGTVTAAEVASQFDSFV